MDKDSFSSTAAKQLRKIADALEAGKYDDITSVVVNLYTDKRLKESWGSHKPARTETSHG